MKNYKRLGKNTLYFFYVDLANGKINSGKYKYKNFLINVIDLKKLKPKEKKKFFINKKESTHMKRKRLGLCSKCLSPNLAIGRQGKSTHCSDCLKKMREKQRERAKRY